MNQNTYQTYQTIVSKIKIVVNQHKNSTNKIEKATLNTISDFEKLLASLDKNIEDTNKIVGNIKRKLSGIIARSTIESSEDNQKINIIKDKYQEMLNQIMDQLSITIERKSEDIAKLDNIKKRVESTAYLSKGILDITDRTKMLAINARIQAAKASNSKTFGIIANEVATLAKNIDEIAQKIETELQSTTDFITNSINSLQEAMNIESSFINSTIALLKEIILSIIDSFVDLSKTMDSTIGESSNFKNKVQEIIIVNLQFEDIFKQMSQHTIDILASIEKDLESLNISVGNHDNLILKTHEAVTKQLDDLFTIKEERTQARESLNNSLNNSSSEDSNESLNEQENLLQSPDNQEFDNLNSDAHQIDNDDDVTFF